MINFGKETIQRCKNSFAFAFATLICLDISEQMQNAVFNNDSIRKLSKQARLYVKK